jgi:hypothetical protein
MTARGYDRSFGDVGSMSGLRESGQSQKSSHDCQRDFAAQRKGRPDEERPSPNTPVKAMKRSGGNV